MSSYMTREITKNELMKNLSCKKIQFEEKPSEFSKIVNRDNNTVMNDDENQLARQTMSKLENSCQTTEANVVKNNYSTKDFLSDYAPEKNLFHKNVFSKSSTLQSFSSIIYKKNGPIKNNDRKRNTKRGPITQNRMTNQFNFKGLLNVSNYKEIVHEIGSKEIVKGIEDAVPIKLKDCTVDKDDSFMNTTEPKDKIDICLSHFSGIFNKQNLDEFLHEALVIVD